jgi:hypothetical protein
VKEKIYFVITDKIIANYKVPVIAVNESLDSKGMLLSGIKNLGVSASPDKLVCFDLDNGKKKAAFFMKSLGIEKEIYAVSVEDLFDNICREQFKDFLKLLAIMHDSGEFLKTELPLFKKIEECR